MVTFLCDVHYTSAAPHSLLVPVLSFNGVRGTAMECFQTLGPPYTCAEMEGGNWCRGDALKGIAFCATLLFSPPPRFSLFSIWRINCEHGSEGQSQSVFCAFGLSFVCSFYGGGRGGIKSGCCQLVNGLSYLLVLIFFTLMDGGA